MKLKKPTREHRVGKARRGAEPKLVLPVPRHLFHPVSEAFGAVLGRLRRARKLSLYRVAQLAQVSREWVARIERGACAFSVDLAARICDALGYAFEWVAAEAVRYRRRGALPGRPL